MDVFGLSPVRQPLNPLDIPCFDIVLVHEFGGHATRTWQPLWATDDGSRKWPDARVLTFGYNETTRHPYGREELSGPAETLLRQLYQLRKEEHTRLRPLVFIGRGAGGFIIKKALVTAWLDAQYRDMFFRTVGVVFFGTPHQSGPRSWREIVSEMFQENPLNRDLRRTAPTDLLRDDDDAALTEISEAFVRIPGLLVVSDTLVEMDGNLDRSLRPTATSFQGCGLETSPSPGLLSGLTKLMRKQSPKGENGALSEEYHRVLQLLRPHKMRREQILAPPTSGTCSWIETRPAFSEWCQKGPESHLLWIRGEMGCGKTYLSRHIAQLIENPQSSHYLAGTTAYCCLQDLTDGYKTPQAVIAWLLHDLLLAYPELAPAIKLKNGFVSDLPLHEVQRHWRSVIAKATNGGRGMTFIVDEIDQLRAYGGILDEFVKILACIEFPRYARSQVRILVLSRPQERLEPTLLRGCGFSSYNITAEDTQPDIEKTAKEVLDVIKRYPGGSGIAEDFRVQIEEGANGMYLWARLALDEAIKRMSPNNKRVGQLTRGIFPLFDQYLEQCFKPNDQDGGAFQQNVLFWTTYQARPMLAEELRMACAMVARITDVRQPDWGNVCVDAPAFRDYRQNIKRHILDECAPLVKIGLDGRIGPVHRSLQEYLTMSKEELPDTPPLPHHTHFYFDNKKAHRNISSLCMDYLLQPALSSGGKTYETMLHNKEVWVADINKRITRLVFLRYAALFWIYHARLSGAPFHVDLEQWDGPKPRRLLGLADHPHNGHAIGWVEVWWETTGMDQEFPRSVLDLGAKFPSEKRRIADPAWNIGDDSAGDEYRAVGLEIEAMVVGFIECIDQLESGLVARNERDEKATKDVEGLNTDMNAGLRGDRGTRDISACLQEKVAVVAVQAAGATKENISDVTVGDEYGAIALEIEAMVIGFIECIDEVELGLMVKSKRDERIIKALESLKTEKSTGVIDDKGTRDKLARLQLKVAAAKGEVQSAKAELESRIKEYNNMERRYGVMEQSLREIRESLSGGKGRLIG